MKSFAFSMNFMKNNKKNIIKYHAFDMKCLEGYLLDPLVLCKKMNTLAIFILEKL